MLRSGRQGKLQIYKCGLGKLQMRARNGIRQARKGIKADKEWHKRRQGKVQRRKEKYKGRPEKVARQGKPKFKRLRLR